MIRSLIDLYDAWGKAESRLAGGERRVKLPLAQSSSSKEEEEEEEDLPRKRGAGKRTE